MNIAYVQSKPPDTLYHGTANRFVSSILETGLLPKGRQQVHLSEDIETAISVGKRRDSQPAIIKIDSLNAHNEGIAFYHAGDSTWLADHIPKEYLERVVTNMMFLHDQMKKEN